MPSGYSVWDCIAAIVSRSIERVRRPARVPAPVVSRRSSSSRGGLLTTQSLARCRNVMAVAAVATVLSCVCGTVAQAGIIPLGGAVSVVGGGTASVTGPFTQVPNNNPTATSSNFAAIQKTFTSSTLTPIDIVFNVNNSQGVTEYLLAEGVFNGTGAKWNDYHVQLGFGTGAGFTLANPAFGLQFDSTPPPSSVNFPTTALAPQKLDFSGGVVLANSGASLSYTIDVPDSATAGSYQFTLRQFPSVVPEPGTFVLAAIGLVGLGLAVRTRARRS
jgi:PEP-CTERM motif